jgi:hypothetical protein
MDFSRARVIPRSYKLSKFYARRIRGGMPNEFMDLEQCRMPRAFFKEARQARVARGAPRS